MKKNIYFLTVIFVYFFLPAAAMAQSLPDFGFIRNDNIQVGDTAGNIYRYAWAGGLNSCQFGKIDLNLDGIKDLVVFDRIGNRILPFFNSGAAGIASWQFAPSYAPYFPEIKEWMMLRDYDGDGKEDIFTYTTGGIKVFRNVSDTMPRFSLATPLLTSYQYGGYVNLLVTLADYPVIADLDSDGDLDILTFFGLGSYISFHKNLSEEKYGTADSLDYQLEEMCWGYFREGTESNVLTLNVHCPYDCADKNLRQKPRHTGSTLLTLDLNADELNDLLIGDVGYKNLIALTNGGTQDSALMISQDTSFPNLEERVNMVSFPVASYLDVDNDNINDLLVSPFDPTMENAENKNSCWWYKNNGENNHPDFQLEATDFLQGDMIDLGSGCYPVFCDLDNDGITDQVAGNYGYLDSSWMYAGSLHTRYYARLVFFKNTGTEIAPEYKLLTSNLGNILSYKLRATIPAFADLDGDGDKDLLLGNANGNLLFFRNEGLVSGIPQFKLTDASFASINVGGYSAPQLFDLNRDGLNDLIIGKKDGALSFYQNTGSQAIPYFTFVTDALGMVDVTDTLLSYDGYSVPCFFRDKNGKTCLFCGSEFGNIFYFNNIDNNLDGTFALAESQLCGIGDGWRNGVAVKDLNSDGFPEMVNGNFAGGITFYQGVVPSASGINELPAATQAVSAYPNPGSNRIFFRFNTSCKTSSFEVNIFDLSERLVLHKTIRKGESLDISSLANGVYCCRLTNLSCKIVVCH